MPKSSLMVDFRLDTMNISTPFLRFDRVATGFLLVLVLMIFSGCSESTQNPTTVSQAPQGELIEGDPIDSPIEELEDPADQTSPSPEEPVPTQDINTIEKTTEVKVTATDSTDDSKEITQSTRVVISTASQPQRLLKIVQDETDLAETNSGYLSVSFDKLASFEYTMPEDLTEPVADESGQVYKEQIPSSIKDLNQKNISLKGFMLPLKVEKSLVTEMLIMRDQSMCCYGTVPKINEWVSVRMQEKGVKPVMDEPVTIYGTLKVGEVLENGYLVGIYEMDGQSMTVDTVEN